MTMGHKIGIVGVASLLTASCIMMGAADTNDWPSIDTTLNDFDPTVPVGEYVLHVVGEYGTTDLVTRVETLESKMDDVETATSNAVMKADIAAPSASADTNKVASAKKTWDELDKKLSKGGGTMTGSLKFPWGYGIMGNGGPGLGYEAYEGKIGCDTTTNSAGMVFGDLLVTLYARNLFDNPNASYSNKKWTIYNTKDGMESYSIFDSCKKAESAVQTDGGTMTGALTIVRGNENIKIDGSTIRFNDVEGDPTGGTISGTNGGGNVNLPRSSGTLALAADTGHAGNLASLDANGNPTNSGIATNDVATKADATLTPVFDPDPTAAKWVCSPASMTGYATPYSVAWERVGVATYTWVLSGGDGSQHSPFGPGDPSAGTLSFEIASYGIGQTEVQYVAATRVPVGYQLGNQFDKPLASKNTTVQQVKLSTASQGAEPISPVGGLVTLPVSNSANSSSGTTLASSKAVKTVNDKTVLNPVYGGNGQRLSDWDWSPKSVRIPPYMSIEVVPTNNHWIIKIGEDQFGDEFGDDTITNYTYSGTYSNKEVTVTASRRENSIIGYYLEGQDTKPLQAMADVALSEVFAPKFSADVTNKIDDLVTYEGRVYRFKSQHYGEWNPAHVTEVKGFVSTNHTGDVYIKGKLGVSRDVRIDGNFYQGVDMQSVSGGAGNHAEGRFTSVTAGDYNHAEGHHATVDGGTGSHAEGYHTIAKRYYAHAEGIYTYANGYGTSGAVGAAHAEGYYSVASNNVTHADGFRAFAKDEVSYVWGGGNSGDTYYFSHGEGSYNIDPIGGLSGFWIGETNMSQYVTLAERGLDKWAATPATIEFAGDTFDTPLPWWDDGTEPYPGSPGWYIDVGGAVRIAVDFGATYGSARVYDTDVTYTRTALQGYQLGSDTNHILASEAEAEALRTSKADKSDLNPLFFAQYYPDGEVKSAAEFTSGIKYNTPDTTNRTITVKPFCNTGTATNDNSNLSGRVVIPPFVDVSHNGYISDNGTRYKVVGVGSGTDSNNSNENLTSVIAPNTVTNIGDKAFRRCTKLKSASIPAAMSIGGGAFNTCSSLVSVSLPAATRIGTYAFNACTKLVSVSLPAVTRIDSWAFYNCTSLASVSLPVVTRVDGHVFDGCIKLVSVSLPVATTIGGCAFYNCTSLASVSLPAAFSVDGYAFYNCTLLESVDFGATLSSVSTLGSNAFNNVPKSCKIIVPDSQYDAWTVASGWRDLYNNGNGYKFLKHSEWEYARKYELEEAIVPKYSLANGDIPYSTNAIANASSIIATALPLSTNVFTATHTCLFYLTMGGASSGTSGISIRVIPGVGAAPFAISYISLKDGAETCIPIPLGRGYSLQLGLSGSNLSSLTGTYLKQ